MTTVVAQPANLQQLFYIKTFERKPAWTNKQQLFNSAIKNYCSTEGKREYMIKLGVLVRPQNFKVSKISQWTFQFLNAEYKSIFFTIDHLQFPYSYDQNISLRLKNMDLLHIK